MRKKNVLSSPHLLKSKKKRRRLAFGKTFFYLFLLTGVFVGLVYASSFSRFNIKGVEVIGAKVVDEAEIRKVAEEELSGKYLWLFPRSNFLIYPKSKMGDRLLDNFKTLKSATIKLTGEESLSIEITEREPRFIWCGRSPEESGECYFMDEGGFIFAPAPYFSGNVYFKFFGDVGSVAPEGVSFASSNFGKLSVYKDVAINLGLDVSHFVVSQEGGAALYFQKKSGVARIIFPLDKDAEKTADNLALVLGSEDLKDKLEALEYIDLRFGNKVYYK
ncbi:MAG: hypothetical protein AAB500_02630 [Patescibacteria group bacterium]